MPSRYRHSSTTEASSGALWKLSDRRSLNHSVRYLDSVNQVALAPLPGSQNIIQTHLDSCEQSDFTGLRLRWSQSGLDSWLSRAGGMGAVGPRSACGEWQLKGEMEHRPGLQEGQRFTRAQKSCPPGECTRMLGAVTISTQVVRWCPWANKRRAGYYRKFSGFLEACFKQT